jgi:hypothetical protein
MAAATTSKAAGWRIPCPNCGAVADDEGDGGLCVQISNMRVLCPGCDSEVTREDLERLAAEVGRLLRWLDLVATV